ncbi:RelA/SpoT domain-containing protein [Shewanella sp. Isolate11]|uniref:RelA/SpoT domain-containing protein n=1 Tax=Shewanella sp. Isolate11 TaxID=2908530 RepID=UPI001EFC5391|nr:RelA/SpoT domain-containing protein [Shewanella sp. Isolate11]MCG9697740.1 RelA/SpoT domain-containing protein [Shewanella sp. Isolate11]
MNRLFRTFFIFLLLLSTRSGFAASYDNNIEINESRSNVAFKQAFSKELHGLYAIPSSSAIVIRQASADFDHLYAQADAAQTELAQLLASIADSPHYQLIIPAIKSAQRAKQKVVNKFNGDASQLTDLARASIVTDNIYSLMTAFETLKDKGVIVQVKNRFAEPKASGYRDLNLLVKLPQTQMIAEVQLHLKSIAEIKSGAEHQVYEMVQNIEAEAKQQQRALLPFEVAKITQLRQQSHKLYHKAWLNYKRIDNARLIAA